MSSIEDGYMPGVNEQHPPGRPGSPELFYRQSPPYRRKIGQHTLSLLGPSSPERLGLHIHRPGWTVEYDGVDPEDEARAEKLFTLGNGGISYTRRLRGPGLVNSKGVYEPTELPAPPDIDKNEQSKVPSLLALFDGWRYRLSGEHGPIILDEMTLSQTLDIEHNILTVSGIGLDAAGHETGITITQFLDRLHPQTGLMKVALRPHHSGPLTFESGIDRRPQTDHNHFTNTASHDIGENRGILYTAESNYGHSIAISQQLQLVEGQRIANRTIPPRQEANGSAWQGIELAPQPGKTYEFVVATNLHSELDAELLQGQVMHPAWRAYLATREMPDFDQRLSRHMTEWEKTWQESHISIDGDPELELALRFNLGHLLANASSEYIWSGIPAKIANKQGYGYNGHYFWDTDTYITPSLPRELRRPQLDYRHQLLPAARHKAAEAGYKGAWWPWQGHLAIPEEVENGEGCPAYIYNNIGRLVPVESYQESIHISADVAYAAMGYYEATGDEAALRRDAEMILEAARFLVSRTTRRDNGQFIYERVTGPDEYHPSVTNNAYTLLMASYTIKAAEDLITGGKVDDRLYESLGLTDEELAHWRHVRENLYIPFDENSLVIDAFEDWRDMKHVDLGSDKYRGVTEMDARLLQENPPPADKSDAELTDHERNPIRTTDVIKQHDTILALMLLGPKILDILPAETVGGLRRQYGNDEALMQAIYKANYNEYAPQTSDGSSLSPSTGVLAALAAGIHPDDCYQTYRRLAQMDLSRENTHGTQNGLHTANAGASVMVLTEGFMGIKPVGDTLAINPRMPSHWKSATRAISALGHDVTVRIDQQNDTVTLTRRRPAETDLPVTINGRTYIFGAAERTASYDVRAAMPRDHQAFATA